jgi:hypothetical protein
MIKKIHSNRAIMENEKLVKAIVFSSVLKALKQLKALLN